MSAGAIAIVIPSLNPDGTLPEYVAALREILPGSPIVLVDDGSDAAHAAVFGDCAGVAADVVVLRHGINQGKGRALKTAFAYLLERHPRLVGCVTCDSDGQHLPEDVRRCAEALSADHEALVLGCRAFAQSHVPLRSRFGNTFIRSFFSVATGRRFLDTQTGLRAIPASFMRELLDCRGERFDFETRMLLSLGARRMVQLPIETVYLNGNRSSHFSPLRDSMKILGIVSGHIVAKFTRFVAASLSSFALDISLFKLLHSVVFRDLGLGRLALSVVLARVVSALFNYWLNLRFVFDGQRARRSFAKYAALALCLLAASYGFLALACATSGFASRHVATAKAIIDLALFVASFAVQRLFVFSRR